MRRLIDDEILALSAILEEAIAQTGDEVDPVFEEVDCAAVNPFGDGKMQSDVYDNLAKYGYIECSIMEDALGKVTEFVCITPQGYEALKAAKGVH